MSCRHRLRPRDFPPAPAGHYARLGRLTRGRFGAPAKGLERVHTHLFIEEPLWRAGYTSAGRQCSEISANMYKTAVHSAPSVARWVDKSFGKGAGRPSSWANALGATGLAVAGHLENRTRPPWPGADGLQARCAAVERGRRGTPGRLCCGTALRQTGPWPHMDIAIPVAVRRLRPERRPAGAEVRVQQEPLL